MCCRRPLVLALLLGGVLAGPLRALDPGRLATQYRHASWGLEDGLFPGSVHCVLQTREGYLWIGTSNGLVRFDGVDFDTPPPPLVDALAGRSVAALLETATGHLWIGTDDGLFVHRGGSVERYGLEEGLSHSRVTALAAGRPGEVWVGTLRGLTRIDDDGLATFDTRDGLPSDYVSSLAYIPDVDTLWVGTYGGLASRDGHSGFHRVEAGPVASGHVTALLPEAAGLWIGLASADLVLRSTDGSLRSWSAPDAVHSLLEDREGQLWVGTYRGLFRFREGAFEAPGGLSDIVLALLEDREGNLWAGTRPAGLHRLSDASFVAWSEREGLPDGAVTAILEDERGDVWVGTRLGLGRLRNGRVVETWTSRDGLADDEILALAEGADGALWIGTQTAIHRLANGGLTRLAPADVGLQGPYWELLVGSGDELWIGAFGGVGRLGRPLARAAGEDHSGASATALAEDAEGRIWIGTLGGGLWRTRAGGELEPAPIAGLPSDAIHSLRAASMGGMWVGTAAGLARVGPEGVHRFRAAQGVPEETVCALLEGGDGALWICTPRGILRVELADLAGLESGVVERARGRWFTTVDGMPSPECHSNDAFATRDGRLWFPTPRGAAVVDPARLVGNRVPPPVVLESLRVDGQPFDLVPDAVLSPGSRRLEFHFTALSFRVPERVRFRYRLAGLDPEWMEGGSERVAHYMNLDPGSYRFEVLAANDDGVWALEPATYAFRLAPHLWATSGFRLAAAAILGFAGFQLYRWRERWVKREFAAVLADRSRMAREIHDTLAQGLAGIAIQLEAADETLASTPDTSRRHLARALALARSSLAEARRSVLGLRPRALDESDLPAALRSTVDETAWGSELSVRVEVPTEPKALPRIVEDNLLRIAQEAVTNAVLHSRARTLRVELAYERYAVALRVVDDGIGFDPDAVFRSPGDRLGLVGMRERSEEMEGRLEVHSAPGAGTRLVLTVPLA